MRVFMVCPANKATGGTELLHQFSRCLSDIGVENYMIYPDGDGIRCPTPETFLKYGVKYVSRYIDAPDTILVLTETQVHLVNECVKGTAMIWWLSVDNYFACYQNRMQTGEVDVFGLRGRQNVVHFVQSAYAKDFVQQQLRVEESYWLSDYINDEIINVARCSGFSMDRQNICLYNPSKGFEALKPIIEACRPDITWIPLKGLKPAEMAALMCNAKLYVDFGHHPGKDRIPREAAVCGCCVITNRKGSAAYWEDVRIPEQYKVEETQDVEGVLNKIHDVIDHYAERRMDFVEYCNMILQEKALFLNDCRLAWSVLSAKAQQKESRNPIYDKETQDRILTSVVGAVNTMRELAIAAQNENGNANPSQVMNQLLTMDYVMQIVRETIYAEMPELYK